MMSGCVLRSHSRMLDPSSEEHPSEASLSQESAIAAIIKPPMQHATVKGGWKLFFGSSRIRERTTTPTNIISNNAGWCVSGKR